jgi:hypothetical protein
MKKRWEGNTDVNNELIIRCGEGREKMVKVVFLCGEGSHRRMARGGHGLPKVSPAPAMPYPSMPYGQATPETNLQLF